VSGDDVCFEGAHLLLSIISVIVLALAGVILIIFAIYTVWKPNHKVYIYIYIYIYITQY